MTSIIATEIAAKSDGWFSMKGQCVECNTLVTAEFSMQDLLENCLRLDASVQPDNLDYPKTLDDFPEPMGRPN